MNKIGSKCMTLFITQKPYDAIKKQVNCVSRQEVSRVRIDSLHLEKNTNTFDRKGLDRFGWAEDFTKFVDYVSGAIVKRVFYCCTDDRVQASHLRRDN